MGNVSVWYDEEGDYLELAREDDEGFFVDLGDGVFERVSEDEETLGFAVLNVSARKQRELPFEVTIKKHPATRKREGFRRLLGKGATTY